MNTEAEKALADEVRVQQAQRRLGREREFRFRFSEVNDMTGRPFAESPFRDLPEFVADVVVDRVGLCPGEWDDLVESGEAYDFVGFSDSYTVPDTVARLVTCTTCGGQGVDLRRLRRCEGCDGEGELFVMAEAKLNRTRRPVEDTILVVGVAA
jgi:hypothetical protein